MPQPTPFHARTSQRCTSLNYKDWAGYHAVCSYDTYHEREYFALRHAAGLIDVSPLFKYDVSGPQAGDFLAYVMVRDVRRLQVGQVTYCCWCDEAGKVLDDGTVWRLDESTYRVTSAEPALSWLTRCAAGFNLHIEDRSAALGALSLQGPKSRDVLSALAGSGLESLRFFRLARARVGSIDVEVTRTGYTGDLGYELWVAADQAPALWDAVMNAGQPHGLLPVGLDAMDMTRIEAGFVLNGIDYFPAQRCFIESRQSTPYELGLGWTVQLKRAPFIGQAALQAERRTGPQRAFVGLVLDWVSYEAMFAEHGLPPEVCNHAWRDAVPVYAADGRHVGQATSGSWSPILKKNLALATVEAGMNQLGLTLEIEVTVEYHRRRCPAIVSPRPFFDPPRKRS
jgi:aminomethyltransferase